MKKIFLRVAFLGCLLFSGTLVQARSTQVQVNDIPWLQGADYVSEICIQNCGNGDPDRWIVVQNKAIPLGSIAASRASVSYNSIVRNNTTNQTFDDGAVSVGDSISFVPQAVQGSDIEWTGTGYWGDSPNGFWGGSGVSCNSPYYISTQQVSTASVDNHVAFRVNANAPTIVKSGSAGLSCDASGFNCTVTSPGTISATITWPNAVGRFYYAGRKTGTVTPRSADWHGQGCNVVPFALYSGAMANASGCSFDYDSRDQQHCLMNQPPYDVNFNASSITHNITVAPNQNPNAPTITGPTTGAPGTYTFTVSATDPDGNQIRYGLDNHPTGAISPEQYRPTSGYVNSGTNQTVSYTFSSNGTYTFRAQTLDNQGGVSGWTEHTIVIGGGGSCTWQYKEPLNDTSDFWMPPNGDPLQRSCPTGWFTYPEQCSNIGISESNDGQPATPGAPSKCALGTASSTANGGYLYCSKPGIMKKVGSGCNVPTPVPSVSFQINGSEGPLDVSRGSSLTLTWASQNSTTCTASGAGWGSLTPIALAGTTTIPANQADTYIIYCTDGVTNSSDSVQVNLTNTLKVCQNSCSSGIQRTAFTMARGGSQTLVACFNSYNGCTDPSGDVTSSATWPESNSPSNAVTLTPGSQIVVTGHTQGQEQFSSTYSGQTQNVDVTVTCVPTVSCTNAPGKDNYCQNETFSVDNGCGVSINCNGTKTCDFNWKEVAP